MVKDDDTYVHVPNLMRALNKSRNGKPLWQQPVSFGRRGRGCPGVCGGSGWVLSTPLAEQLVGRYGDRYLQFAAEMIVNHIGHYDVYVPTVVSWLGYKLEDMLEMNDFSPTDEKKIVELEQGWDTTVKCIRLNYSRCSRSASPATWHIKHNFGDSLKLLDAEP
uniref:Hexosyltransferase n=1 Tax=Pyrodinium bahamense TaxID=73915 RepID=A0A7S0FY60_9DINO|mmetsp:Transcript_9416/g.26478  ORF Transcript_9416/g.26478 Transcript_9416/m.26478 type:complete len:163 (+) Transcript_9416:2-490(+)